jgi:putative membrane protein
MVRQGVWGWTEWIVPLTHLQSVSIQRSFFQRRLGVATLSIDLAGQDGGDPVTMPDLPEETAQSIYTRLAQFVHTPISREADKVSGLS